MGKLQSVQINDSTEFEHLLIQEATTNPKRASTEVYPKKIGPSTLMEGKVLRVGKQVRAKETPYIMILTDQPRLYLVSELQQKSKKVLKKQVQKDIMLHQGLRAKLLRDHIFKVSCSASQDEFEYISDQASQWVKAINKVARNQSH